MAKRKPKITEASQIRAAGTPEGREQQLTSLAYDLVEKRLMDGSASSAETVHFLKLSSAKARLERRKLAREVELLEAKTEAIKASQHNEEIAAKALEAFKIYGGSSDV